MDDIKSRILKSGVVYLDTETTGLHFESDRLRLITIAYPKHVSSEVDVIDMFTEVDNSLLSCLNEVTVVAHNALFDLSQLAWKGIKPRAARCTYLAAKVLYGGDRTKRCGLAACLKRELGIEVDKAEQKSDWGAETLSESQMEYAKSDVVYLEALDRALMSKVKAAGLDRAVGLEFDCLQPIVDMMCSGVGVDAEKWVDTYRLCAGQLEESEKELKRDLKVDNVNSTQQVAVALIAAGTGLGSIRPEHLERDLLGEIDVKASCRALKALGVLPGTSAEALTEIEPTPVVTRLLAYRKLKSFVGGIGKAINAALERSGDGRVRPSLRLLSAPTGRMGCSEPNLLAVPKRGLSVRDCIVPRAGYKLIVTDYAAIELRVLAHITQCPVMVKAFRDGQDLHRLTASSMAGIPESEVTPVQRQQAKAVNFGFAFGMGAARFMNYAKQSYGMELTVDEAYAYKNAYLTTYPGVAAWQYDIGAKSPPEMRTASGRIRYFRDPNKGYCERLNTPVQGTAADGLKRSIALLWERLKPFDAYMLLPVHDELLVECSCDIAEQVQTIVCDTMVEGMSEYVTSVPIEVESEIKDSWGK